MDLDRIFHLKENHTDVKTEVMAGVTSFMTMAYIIALNPNLLTGFGANGQELWNARSPHGATLNRGKTRRLYSMISRMARSRSAVSCRNAFIGRK